MLTDVVLVALLGLPSVLVESRVAIRTHISLAGNNLYHYQMAGSTSPATIRKVSQKTSLNMDSSIVGDGIHLPGPERRQGCSSETLTQATLLSLPVQSIESAVMLHNGVVGLRPNTDTWGALKNADGVRPPRESITTPELDVRGGRPYENAFLLDGVNISNQMSGNTTMRVSPRVLSSAEFHSGVLPPEYGSANAAVFDMRSLDGSTGYSGMVEAITDNINTGSHDQNWYTARLSGPVPFVNKGTFVGFVERRWFGDRNPSSVTESSLPGGSNRLPGNWLDGWSYLGKLQYNLGRRANLTLSAAGSREEWSEYRHAYLFNIAHTPYCKDDNLVLSARLTGSSDAGLNFGLSLSYFKSSRFRGDGVHREDLWAYGRFHGNPGRDPWRLFWSYDNPATPLTFDTLWVITEMIGPTADGSCWATDSALRAFRSDTDEGHVWNDYSKRQSTCLTLKGVFDGKVDRRQTVRLGWEIQWQTMRLYNHTYPINTYRGIPWGGFVLVNRYGYDVFGKESDSEDWRSEAKHPLTYSFHVEDRIDLPFLTLMPGLRVDHFRYNTLQIRDPDRPLDAVPNDDYTGYFLDRSDLTGTKNYTLWSPRLAAAFPVTENSLCTFSYGIQYQNPPLQNIYIGFDFLERNLQGLVPDDQLGTLAPEPEKKTLYDLSYSHQINKTIHLTTRFYYNRATNLTQTYWYEIYGYFLRHANESVAKGVELTLTTPPINQVSLNLKYTLALANQKGPMNWSGSPEDSTVYHPLDYDQQHRFVGLVRLNLQKGDGPRIGGFYPLEEMRINLLIKMASGLPYSPAPVHVYDEAGIPSTSGEYWPRLSDTYNSSRAPYTMTIDVRAERPVVIAGVTLTPFIWIRNLTNRQNITNVWRGTGQPHKTGWLDTINGQEYINDDPIVPDRTGLTGEQKYHIKQLHPQNYGNPRQIYVGLRASF